MRVPPLVASLLVAAPLPLFAAIHRVDADATGLADGSSWDDAFPSLQDALAIVTSGDDLWIAEGTYFPDEGGGQTDNDRDATFNLPPGIDLYGGFEGNEGAPGERDPEAHPTILSGDLMQDDGTAGSADNARHVLTATTAGTTITLEGLHIVAGRADGTFPDDRGGGLLCADDATVLLRNCWIEDNVAIMGKGGGVYTLASVTRFEDCRLEGNTAAGGEGGAVFSDGSNTDFFDCHFAGNSALRGGALHIRDTDSLLIWDCTFEGNTAIGSQSRGGAVHVAAEDAWFLRCSFRGNSASGGGAMTSDGAGFQRFDNCEFTGNFASSNGGALRPGSFSDNLLQNCSFEGNRAGGTGGAVWVFDLSLTMTNCLIWNNESSGATTDPDSSLTYDDTTPNFTHCLFENIDLTAVGTGNFDGTAPANDPLFAVELDPATAPAVGGDLRLRHGSPAINAGGPLSFGVGITDVALRPRLVGTIDLGAHERQAVIYVDADADVSGLDAGLSWCEAFVSLQDALAVAIAGDEIWVAEGTYLPGAGDRGASFGLVSSVGIYSGFTGTESSRSERDPSSHAAVLSGAVDGDDGFPGNSYHVVVADGVNSNAVLDGLVIYAGNADGKSSQTTGGGLFCVNGAAPRIVGCRFINNAAVAGGGVLNNGSSPSFTRCDFQINTATDGGAMFNYQCPAVTVVDCTFRFNGCQFDGAAAYNQLSTVDFTNCVFEGNTVPQFGGALYNISSTVTTTNCVVAGNTAGEGGGFYLDGGTTTIINGSFQGNAAGVGGAIVNNASNVTFDNTLIWRNAEAGVTANATSSLDNRTTTPAYRHCMIHNHPATVLNATGSGNLNDADPDFVREIDPASAPATGSDLRLLTGSPFLDVGDNALNPESLDLAGAARIQNGTIDLGAFEGPFVSFAHLYPTLHPGADDNDNGHSNFKDYAVGADPTAPHNPSLYPRLTGSQLTLGYRDRAADLLVEFQKGTDLQNWFEMIEGVDYTTNSSSATGDRTELTLDLLVGPPGNPVIFFREEFFELAR